MADDVPDATERAWIEWLRRELAAEGRRIDRLDVSIPTDRFCEWRLAASLPAGVDGPMGRDGRACLVETTGIHGDRPRPGGGGPEEDVVRSAGLRLWRRLATAAVARPRAGWTVLAHPLVIATCRAAEPAAGALPLADDDGPTPGAWTTARDCQIDLRLEEGALVGAMWFEQVAVEASRSAVELVGPPLPETVLASLHGASLGLLAAFPRTGRREVDEAVAGLRIASLSNDTDAPSSRIRIEPARWLPYARPPDERTADIMDAGPIVA